MNSEPQKEHRWLQKLIGEWDHELECSTEPGKPPEQFKGTETVRPVGDLWVLCEGRGEMPGGGAATTVMTLGYDPRRERFVGTWIGSMMAWLWVYEGSLDASGKVLTLETEGPICTGDGKLAKYRDVIEFENDDHRVLTSHVLGEDGNWQPFMTAHYRRQK